jgi:flagellar basal-body rod protein FlgB
LRLLHGLTGADAAYHASVLKGCAGCRSGFGGTANTTHKYHDRQEIAMVDKLDDALGFYQQALNLRSYRQQVLATNIANADTPNYKARDIDFNSTLAAVQNDATGSGTRLAMTNTSTGHLAGNGGGAGVPGNPALLYRTTLQMSADGNSVDMDVERAKFADNALHYEANVTFISGQIKTMLAAVQS